MNKNQMKNAGVLVSAACLVSTVAACDPTLPDNPVEPKLRLALDVALPEGEGTSLEDTYAAILWTRRDSSGADAILNHLVPQILGPVPVEGGHAEFEVRVDPPADAIGYDTCAGAGLDLPFCEDAPDDRYANGRIYLFRDNNGNGTLDVIGPDASGFVDDLLAYPTDPMVGLFYVESFTNPTLRETYWGSAWGQYPDAAFEPGYHVIDFGPPLTAETAQDDPCTQCRHEEQAACGQEEEACVNNGGTDDECFEAFAACYHVTTTCQELCENELIDDEAIAITVPETVDPSINLDACTEWPRTTDGCSEDMGTVLAQSCLSPGGDVYFLAVLVPYDPTVEICRPETVCTTVVALPTDAVPENWPCDVTVGLEGDTCDPAASPSTCHPALTCSSAGVCGQPED